MFPLAELSAAHDVVCSFVSDKALLHEMLTHLLFVTCHVQMGLGHIGIAFLCAEQRRKNMLIRMDVDGPAGREGGEERRDRTLQNGASRKEQRRPDQTQPHNGTASKSARDATGAGRNGAAAAAADPSLPFRRSAPAFILLSVLPYMIQIILFGNLNRFAFMNVRNRIHRAVRIRGPFDHDAHLTALAADGAAGPEVYGASVDTVVDTGERRDGEAGEGGGRAVETTESDIRRSLTRVFLERRPSHCVFVQLKCGFLSHDFKLHVCGRLLLLTVPGERNGRSKQRSPETPARG